MVCLRMHTNLFICIPTLGIDRLTCGTTAHDTSGNNRAKGATKPENSNGNRSTKMNNVTLHDVNSIMNIDLR